MAEDTGTVSTTTKSNRTSRFYSIMLKQIVDAGYLSPGTLVASTNSVWPATGVVNADGTITVNGTNQPTPSAWPPGSQGRGRQRLGLLDHRKHRRKDHASHAAHSLPGRPR